MPNSKWTWNIGRDDIKLVVCTLVFILLIAIFLPENPQNRLVRNLIAVYDDSLPETPPIPRASSTNHESPFDFDAAMSAIEHLAKLPKERVQIGTDGVTADNVLLGLAWIAVKSNRLDLIERIVRSYPKLLPPDLLFMNAAIWSALSGKEEQSEVFLSRISSPTYRAQAFAAVASALQGADATDLAQKLCSKAYTTLQTPDASASSYQCFHSILAIFVLSHKLHNEKIYLQVSERLVEYIESAMSRSPQPEYPTFMNEVPLIYRILGSHEQVDLQRRLDKLWVTANRSNSPVPSIIQNCCLLERLKTLGNVDAARSMFSKLNPDIFRFRAGIIVLQNPKFVSMHPTVQDELCRILDRLSEDDLVEPFSRLLTSSGLNEVQHSFRKIAFEHLAANVRKRKNRVDRQANLRFVALDCASFHPDLADACLREGFSVFDVSKQRSTSSSVSSEVDQTSAQELRMPLFKNAACNIYINAHLRLGQLNDAVQILSAVPSKVDRGISRLQILQYCWAHRQREKVMSNLASLPGEGLADFPIVEALLVTSLRIQDWNRAEVLCGLLDSSREGRQNLYAFYLGSQCGRELSDQEVSKKNPRLSDNSAVMFSIGKESSSFTKKDWSDKNPLGFVSGDDEFDILMRDTPDEYR